MLANTSDPGSSPCVTTPSRLRSIAPERRPPPPRPPPASSIASGCSSTSCPPSVAPVSKSGSSSSGGTSTMGLRPGGRGRFGTTGLTLGDSGAFGLAPPNRGGAPTPGRFGTAGATGGAFATGASISISVSKSGSSSIAASGALSSSATVGSNSAGGGNDIRGDFILQRRRRLRVELDLAELRGRGLEPFEHASRGAGFEPIDETRGLDFERGIGLGDDRLDQAFDDRLRFERRLGRQLGSRWDAPRYRRVASPGGIHLEEHQARPLPSTRLRWVVRRVRLGRPGGRRSPAGGPPRVR